MRPVGPTYTVELFPGLHEHLLTLLRSLAPDDWNKPTACRLWSVRDVAAHMLDGDLRKLSVVRDGYLQAPERPIVSNHDLVEFLNQLNAQFVTAARRLSPQVLIDLLAFTGPKVYAAITALDANADSAYPVSWAGERRSANWFDIGREYTERWHHQQQMRDAVGAPPLTSREWLHPVLDIFIRALPFQYRDVQASEGDAITVTVSGKAGGTWTLLRDENEWQLFDGSESSPRSLVIISQDDAWRLFTKGMHGETAESRAIVEGDADLAGPFFGTIAVVG
jgi:uncharacterized protein (TIGR03083 family)